MVFEICGRPNVGWHSHRLADVTITIVFEAVEVSFDILGDLSCNEER